ncbi:MAG: peptidoglycan glycosyltransferase [Spirochaetales bacterium]|nr:peptidoglycan glycosyltransferase [Spirochaetales bacterium]
MLLTPEIQQNPARRTTVERGPILDRNGRILAIQTELYSVTAWKPEIEDRNRIIDVLGPIIGMDAGSIVAILSRQASFNYIKRKVTQRESDRIKELIDSGELPGIHLQREFSRTYPEENLASHILGIVGVDNEGLEGLELVYNNILSPPIEESNQDIVYGSQLFLTIDVNIQYMAEKLVAKTLDENQADSVMILVMDARNGDLLGYASAPDFNPNVYNSFPPRNRLNRPALSAYEPGSVFKVFTIASMLEIGGVTQQSTFTCNGYYEHPDIPEPINCLGTHGVVNPTAIIKYSCNAGAAYASELVATNMFYDMLRRFGFGSETALPFPGESNGLLTQPAQWSARTKPTMAFGQEISVSAVQIAVAATSFANAGMILEPHIVKKIVSPEGRVLEEYARKPLSDAISQETARAMLLMMEQATLSGATATRAAIDGVRVSAKTGTAQIFDVKTGKYSEEAFIASCLAIFPTDDPRLVVYSVIEHPKAGETYGGRIAAPMIREIGRELVEYLEIPKSSDIVYEHDGTVRVSSAPELVLGNVLPDFTGYAKRQLMSLLQNRDVKFDINGEGWVIKQNPAPGTPIEKGMLIKLDLE